MTAAILRTPAASRTRKPSQRSVRTAGYHTMMVGITLMYILPVLWAVSMSFRTNANLFSTSQLIPHPITFEHYRNLFTSIPELSRYFTNTLVIAVLGTIGTLLASSAAGYALARLRFPGRNAFLVLLLLTLMVPVQVTLIPQYVLFRQLHWLNTILPIVVPTFFGTPFATFFFRQFFATLPPSLEEAAMIDGAGPWRTFRSVIAPNARPAYLAIGLLTFVALYNNYFLATLYLPSQDNWVLTQALQSLQGTYTSSYGEIMAGVTVVSLPIMITYVVLQRWVIRGITMTGMAN